MVMQAAWIVAPSPDDRDAELRERNRLLDQEVAIATPGGGVAIAGASVRKGSTRW